jgi:branched-chain amino acid transport system permease protein
MAESLGINVDRLFAITFAFGSGMAAIGGGLGAEFLGLDPQYALKYRAAAIASYFAFPDYLGFGTELLIAVLFALSLDLVLGYAGIITLGQAAFFGTGAYTVGLLAFHGIWTEPITSLLIAALAAAIVGLASGLVLLRTGGLTLLMLTICIMALLEQAANMAHDYTGAR